MKKTIRQQYKTLRDSLSPREIEKNSEAIYKFITSSSLWKEAQRIMCYLAIGNEVRTKAIIDKAWEEGKEVVIPVCTENAIILPSLLSSFLDLEPRTMGILEPREGKLKEIDPQTIELCLIPGIAFDYQGNRLGFGAGYYDRFLPLLKNSTPKVALAHQVQVSKEPLPTNPYDIPMDYLCTELGLVSIKN
ncbi:MAG: 5-formyltetrahydrofolate cyclo-ligase [Clostridia bacterium]|jgi:5-formyltetrahydrofolate cyclo-ligase|nr:5-formyltetrahydrofolate cyclo-ligase [Clostridia bacterium]